MEKKIWALKHSDLQKNVSSSYFNLTIHIYHQCNKMKGKAGSSCLGTFSSLSPLPSFSVLRLLDWVAKSSKSWGIVCRCAWREASPSALGEHVVWECLRWLSFKLSPTQHAGVCLFSDDNARAFAHIGGHFQVEVTPVVWAYFVDKQNDKTGNVK